MTTQMMTHANEMTDRERETEAFSPVSGYEDNAGGVFLVQSDRVYENADTTPGCGLNDIRNLYIGETEWWTVATYPLAKQPVDEMELIATFDGETLVLFTSRMGEGGLVYFGIQRV